jgi:hypothetical protein
LLGLHCSGPQKVADASEHCLLFLGFPALRLAVPNLTGLFAGAALLRTSKGLLTPPCTASYFWTSQLLNWPFQISLAYSLGLHYSGPQKVADASVHCLLFWASQL